MCVCARAYVHAISQTVMMPLSLIFHENSQTNRQLDPSAPWTPCT